MKAAHVLRGALGAAVVALALAGAPGAARAQSGSGAQQAIEECKRLLDSDKLARAAKKCDEAISSDPRGVSPGGYALRASIFLRQKKYEEGLKWIDGVASKAHPNDPTILEVKAAILARMNGRQDEAIKVAQEAVAKDPKRFVAQRLLGDYYARIGSGKAKETVTAYEAYLKYRPDDASKGDGIVLVQLGFAYQHLGRAEGSIEWHKKAESSFDKALKVGGGDATVGPNAQKGKCSSLVARAQLENSPRLYDQAITVCEGVIKNRKAMRGDASPHYNVCIAYLERNQLDKAVAAANSYIQQKPNDYRGYLLRGKIYFRQDKFNEAEGQFNRANELAPDNIDVALARGKNFRKQKQTARAIALLEKVASARPNEPEVLTELARSYLENKQPNEAAATAEKALELPGQSQNVPLLVLAGDAYYVGGKLPEAQKKYQTALSINKQENRARNQLVNTIVLQAYVPFGKGNMADAKKLLNDALAVDPDSTIANFNLGVIALDEGRWNDAVKFLSVRAKRTPNDMVTNRLLAKAYYNLGKNNEATDYYAKAEAEAKAQRNNTVLAEIYTEWAPLLLAAGKVDEAVDKLEIADQFAGTNTALQKATQTNLQIAYFRRGYERWKSRKWGDAISDLEGANRYPANLSNKQAEAYEFALGLAYLSAGQEAKALPIFQKYSKQGVLPFLKSPWDKIGAQFFMAYALYNEKTPGSLAQAAATFEKILPSTSGGIAARTKALIRSTHEWIAYNNYGNPKVAEAELKKAESYAGAGDKKNIDHNQAVLEMLGKKGNPAAKLQQLGDDPPEALVNLGIIADQQGDSQKAYNLWKQAQAKGARSGNLAAWIDAKKRIFGYQ